MSSPVVYKASLFCLAVLICLLASPPVEAVETESCLMCHKYRFIGRIDEGGKKHDYSVDPQIFSNSLHKSVACRDCHTSITKLPHDPVDAAAKVDCATQCHIKPPFSKEKFSHEKIIKIYENSVHSIRPDDPPEVRQAKPDCKFCHLNPIYSRLEQSRVDHDKSLERCLNCHREKGVTQAYVHITHRLRSKTSRSPQEIVALCSKCHADKAMLRRIDAPADNLDAVETYKRSIHGKFNTLGSDMTADCISCHATNQLHDIYREENPEATIHRDNLAGTCRQCHDQTNDWFVKVAVHPRVEKESNPVVFFAGLLFRFMLYGAVLSMVGLMLFETYGRKKRGVKFLLKNGSSWRRGPKVKPDKKR